MLAKHLKDPADLAAVIVSLGDLEDGAVYRNTATGWVGRLRKPKEVGNVALGPKDGRPRVDLLGASQKTDQTVEYRSAAIADLERVDSEPVGFGRAE